MPVTAHSSNEHTPNVRTREARNNGKTLSCTACQATWLLRGRLPWPVPGAPGAEQNFCRGGALLRLSAREKEQILHLLLSTILRISYRPLFRAKGYSEEQTKVM